MARTGTPARRGWLPQEVTLALIVGFVGIATALITLWGSAGSSRCQLAVDMLTDESPNPMLTPEARRALADAAAREALRCFEE